MLTFAFSLIVSFTFAQSKSVESFHQAMSGKDGVSVNINLSGSFLSWLADDDDDALKGVTSIKILTIEEHKMSSSAFKELTTNIKREGFDEWMMVKEGSESEVLFLAKEKGKMITDLVMLVQGSGDYVVMELTGTIDPSKLEDGSWDIDIDGMEHFKKVKKNKN